jgi:hypothetical protein
MEILFLVRRAATLRLSSTGCHRPFRGGIRVRESVRMRSFTQPRCLADCNAVLLVKDRYGLVLAAMVRPP